MTTALGPNASPTKAMHCGSKENDGPAATSPELTVIRCRVGDTMANPRYAPKSGGFRQPGEMQSMKSRRRFWSLIPDPILYLYSTCFKLPSVEGGATVSNSRFGASKKSDGKLVSLAPILPTVHDRELLAHPSAVHDRN